MDPQAAGEGRNDADNDENYTGMDQNDAGMKRNEDVDRSGAGIDGDSFGGEGSQDAVAHISLTIQSVAQADQVGRQARAGR